MIRPGLVSVTFRALKPAEIVTLCSRAGLEGIEWGGDIHVPHGNLALAREARMLTEDEGLQVAAYGSYYRLGYSDTEDAGPDMSLSFESVLETAVELGAPSIRVWAGVKGSTKAEGVVSATADDWQRTIEDAALIAALAEPTGIAVAYEYHSGTLTDNSLSAGLLMQETAEFGLRTLWQPLDEGGGGHPADEAALRTMLPWLLNLHVYNWKNGKRLPLADAQNEWLDFFDIATETGRAHWALLEFVRDDSPDALLEDAAALTEVLSRL